MSKKTKIKKNSVSSQSSSQYVNVIKTNCPYCNKRVVAKSDPFFEDVYFCTECNEEIFEEIFEH